MHPLRRFIKKQGLTIQEFVDQYKIGLSRSFVVMVCCGTANLAKGTAEKISRATGIPPEVLMFPELDKEFARHKKEKEQKKAKGANVCKAKELQAKTQSFHIYFI